MAQTQRKVTAWAILGLTVRRPADGTGLFGSFQAKGPTSKDILSGTLTMYTQWNNEMRFPHRDNPSKREMVVSVRIQGNVNGLPLDASFTIEVEEPFDKGRSRHAYFGLQDPTDSARRKVWDLEAPLFAALSAWIESIGGTWAEFVQAIGAQQDSRDALSNMEQAEQTMAEAKDLLASADAKFAAAQPALGKLFKVLVQQKEETTE